jgi:hypothetical protein
MYSKLFLYHGMAPSGTELALLPVHLPLLLHAGTSLTSYSEILISERLKVKNIYQGTRAEFLCVVFLKIRSSGI